jgi:hypothetical protein
VLEPSSVNFGQVALSQTSARTFEIKNLTDFDVAFQFDIDCSQSSFILSCSNGKLKSGETKLIQVILKPQFSIIYYKKLACLVENHVRLSNRAVFCFLFFNFFLGYNLY